MMRTHFNTRIYGCYSILSGGRGERPNLDSEVEELPHEDLLCTSQA